MQPLEESSTQEEGGKRKSVEVNSSQSSSTTSGSKGQPVNVELQGVVAEGTEIPAVRNEPASVVSPLFVAVQPDPVDNLMEAVKVAWPEPACIDY